MSYTRRISLDNDFYNKQIDDILYGMMLSLSTYHPNEKKLYLTEKKYEANRNEFYQIDTISDKAAKAKALNRHLEKLIDRKLVEKGTIEINKKKEKCFFFPYDYNGNYYIVDKEVLAYLVTTRKAQAVQIFIYLADRMKYINETKGNDRKVEDLWSFSATEIAQKIGYSKNTKEILKRIRIILVDLQHCGLIKYTNYYETISERHGGQVVTPKYRLLSVATKLEDFLNDEEIHEIRGDIVFPSTPAPEAVDESKIVDSASTEEAFSF